MDIKNLTITRIHEGLKKKEFSAVELTEHFLNHIKQRNKDIYAYLTVTDELALSQAKKIDQKISNNESIGLLAGVPAGIKDIILVEGVRATAGSQILKNYIAPYDATVIKRLKQAGIAILGKTNLDEFGMGASGENSSYGPTKNPLNVSRVPGGSSSGSAAAVADNQCVFALGSDTGGSSRQPASFCGIVGFKPTYGRISRYGLIAHGSSLDQIGIMAKNVEDVEAIFQAISGRDSMDATTVAQEYKKHDIKAVKGLKIGVPKEYFIEGLDPEVEKVVKRGIARYEQMGAEIIDLSLPHADYALACYYIIMPAEASANLARYDGIKFGLSARASDLAANYLITREQGFGDEVIRRIMTGAYVLSAGYYDAYYLKAQQVRSLIKQDFDKAFDKVDVIMGPTAPTTAFKLGEKTDDPIAMYLADIYTVSANLAGIPAVSIPCGKTDSSVGGLPVGMQIAGPQLSDERILQIANKFNS